MVDDRHAEQVGGPVVRVRVEALAGEEQVAEAGEIVLAEVLAARVLLLDRPQRRRRGEERLHPVLGDDAPERARVGRADRLPLVEHRRAAGQKRRVDDVRMADDPTDV